VIGNTAATSSEVLIWQNPELAASWHHGGAIRFGADGNLYIATGDQLSSANAQDLRNQHGKLLRVRPDGSIPPDNPFVGMANRQPQIFAYGLRNPFRFVVDGLSGVIWTGNVGGNSATSWEEINRGASGANHGWPDQEGRAASLRHGHADGERVDAPGGHLRRPAAAAVCEQDAGGEPEPDWRACHRHPQGNFSIIHLQPDRSAPGRSDVHVVEIDRRPHSDRKVLTGFRPGKQLECRHRDDEQYAEYPGDAIKHGNNDSQ